MELKGSLRNFSLPDIIQLIGSTRRSGVLVITEGPEKASLYFDAGNIVHASFRNLSGQEAINRIFKQEEGSFQFLSEVEAPKRTVSQDWMGVIMEAARLHDENQRDLGLDDLDFEAAMAEPEAPEGSPEREKDSSWDPERVRKAMAAVLEESFGRKAKKITQELKKNPGSKLSLLEFCDKAEKYITVFIDNRKAEEVANRLRSVIEEALQ